MFQENLLKGRAIFLTGGGTGLGRSMALRFAELGARMFLVGRREEPLPRVSADQNQIADEGDNDQDQQYELLRRPHPRPAA